MYFYLTKKIHFKIGTETELSIANSHKEFFCKSIKSQSSFFKLDPNSQKMNADAQLWIRGSKMYIAKARISVELAYFWPHMVLEENSVCLE